MIDFIMDNAGVVGLLFFLSVFIGILIWAFAPANKQKIESYKFIPLAEDTHD